MLICRQVFSLKINKDKVFRLIKNSEYIKLVENSSNKIIVVKVIPPKNPVALIPCRKNGYFSDCLSDIVLSYKLMNRYFYLNCLRVLKLGHNDSSKLHLNF